MTLRVKRAAPDLCDGRLVLVHEGGYSEVYVPFCAHATIEALSGSVITAPDPLAQTLKVRQPSSRFDGFLREVVRDFSKQLARGGLGFLLENPAPLNEESENRP